MAILDLFKPKTKIHTIAIGDFGTQGIGDTVSAEHKPQLQGKKGTETYEKMAYDSQVGMILNTIKSPILSADWDIITKSDDKKQIEHAEFSKEYFFKNYPCPWQNLLYQILTFVEYGFSTFEQIYRLWTWQGTRYHVPELLARMQTSIEEIQPENKLVVQNKTDGKQVQIPFDVLVFFILNQEGNDMRGTSLLRWSYWDWKRKDETEIIDAIGVRKNALGIPTMKIPQSIKRGSTDYTELTKLLEKIGRSQNPYMIYGEGYEFKWEFGNYNNAITNQKIARHNSQMAKTVMVQFLELGQSGKGGAYALGDVQSQIFLDSLQYIVDLVTTVFNRAIIKPMIDLNFGEQNIYPELVGLNINKAKIQQFIDNYAKMLEKGGIEPTINDEDFIRTKMEMPNLTEDEKKLRLEKKLNPPTPPIPPTPDENNSDNGDTPPDDNDGEPMQMSEEKARIFKLQEPSVTELTKNRREFMDFYVPQMTDYMQSNLTLVKQKYLRDLEVQLNKGTTETQGLKNVPVPFERKYKDGISKKISYFAAWGWRQAKKDASKHKAKKLAEIPDENPQNLSKELKAYVVNLTDSTVDAQYVNMKTKAVFTIQRKMDNGFTVKQAISEANKVLDDYIDSGQLNTASNYIVGDGTNTGSLKFFEEASDIIQAYRYIAVDDGKTTPLCRWLSGHIYSKDSAEFSQIRPPLHYNCSSFSKPIYEDEPKVTPDNELPPPSVWNTRNF